jgi:hypothetical protein
VTVKREDMKWAKIMTTAMGQSRRALPCCKQMTLVVVTCYCLRLVPCGVCARADLKLPLAVSPCGHRAWS